MSQLFQTISVLSCYERAFGPMHSQTARTVATGSPGKAQKNYAEQQVRDNKVCASYLTSKHERDNYFFNAQIFFTVKRRLMRTLLKHRKVKNFQNLLPTPQLAAGMFASKRFRFFSAAKWSCVSTTAWSCMGSIVLLQCSRQHCIRWPSKVSTISPEFLASTSS